MVETKFAMIQLERDLVYKLKYIKIKNKLKNYSEVIEYLLNKK